VSKRERPLPSEADESQAKNSRIQTCLAGIAIDVSIVIPVLISNETSEKRESSSLVERDPTNPHSRPSIDPVAIRKTADHTAKRWGEQALC